MAYNEKLSDRIREALQDLPNVTEKLMFGGICYMVNEKMCVGVVKEEMMCRVDPSKTEQLLELDGCRPMDFTKTPMKGFVYVSEDGLKKKEQFDFWIQQCLEYNPLAKASPKKKKITKK
jgi:TfoX/Sxy family transcriptional regulator of competence genes